MSITEGDGRSASPVKPPPWKVREGTALCRPEAELQRILGGPRAFRALFSGDAEISRDLTVAPKADVSGTHRHSTRRSVHHQGPRLGGSQEALVSTAHSVHARDV